MYISTLNLTAYRSLLLKWTYVIEKDFCHSLNYPLKIYRNDSLVWLLNTLKQQHLVSKQGLDQMWSCRNSVVLWVGTFYIVFRAHGYCADQQNMHVGKSRNRMAVYFSSLRCPSQPICPKCLVLGRCCNPTRMEKKLQMFLFWHCCNPFWNEKGTGWKGLVIFWWLVLTEYRCCLLVCCKHCIGRVTPESVDWFVANPCSEHRECAKLISAEGGLPWGNRIHVPRYCKCSVHKFSLLIKH